MIFDPAVGKTLMVGGAPNGSFNAPVPQDAWLWDGTTWSKLNGVPQFVWVRAVYDKTRKVVVVYGSDLNDFGTWTWDGVNWSKLSPAHMPPPRTFPLMCYDEQSKTTLLFGGRSNFALADTWEWNGVDWIQDHPTSSPAARFDGTMVCGVDRVVLTGGASSWAPFNDVWTWDRHTWSRLVSAHLPTGLQGAGGVFDGTRYLVLLGFPGSLPIDSDVWAYDGTDWTRVGSS